MPIAVGGNSQDICGFGVSPTGTLQRQPELCSKAHGGHMCSEPMEAIEGHWKLCLKILKSLWRAGVGVDLGTDPVASGGFEGPKICRFNYSQVLLSVGISGKKHLQRK